MNDDLSQLETDAAESDSGHHRRHRHKRKRGHRKKVYRQLIIGLLFVLACVGAFLVWHLLVQDPSARPNASFHLAR